MTCSDPRESLSEKLARTANSVNILFGEQVTTISSDEYHDVAKTIGERLAAKVVIHGDDPVSVPDDLLRAITETACLMLPVDHPSRSRFLDDEVAIAYAANVYVACVTEASV